jgi:hypothetical protein
MPCAIQLSHCINAPMRQCANQECGNAAIGNHSMNAPIGNRQSAMDAI